MLFTREPLEKIIKGEIHHTFHSKQQRAALQLPADNRIAIHGTLGSQERPIIYVTVHCTENGAVLTKKQYLQILTAMTTYVADYPKRDSKWQMADALANGIDWISPSTTQARTSDRDWTGHTKTKGLGRWTKGIPHPRRYCTSNNTPGKVETFVDQMRKRLRRIPTSKDDDPLLFSLIILVGHTKSTAGRISISSIQTPQHI